MSKDNTRAGDECGKLAFYTSSVGGYSEYVDKLDRFLSNYKGRASITEVMEMPNWLFHGLYVRIVQRLSTEEGQQEAALESVIDKATGGA